MCEHDIRRAAFEHVHVGCMAYQTVLPLPTSPWSRRTMRRFSEARSFSEQHE